MTATAHGHSRTVLFVCTHGAFRSRLAAAFYNAQAPLGSRAMSAGLEPAEAVSDAARLLLAGDAAEVFLDLSPPEAIPESCSASDVVAIDCRVEGAEVWNLQHHETDRGLCDELRLRVGQLLARSLEVDPLSLKPCD